MFLSSLCCLNCFLCFSLCCGWPDVVCLFVLAMFVCFVFSLFVCSFARLLFVIFLCVLLGMFCFLLVCHLAWWSPVPIAHEADDPHWSSWPLPYTSAGELADVGVYCRDCCRSARGFVESAQLTRHGPRALPMAAQASQMRTLEERTVADASNGIVFISVHGLHCWLENS